MSEDRIVTLLFTDLVSSTELNERLGDDAAAELRRIHFRLLREAVQAHGGEEVKNLGDGLMCVFGSAVNAFACAIAMQQAAHRHNRQGGTPIDVRIGLNAGEPIRDEEDYFGTSVNVAKRVCDAADGGHILTTELVRGLVGPRGRFSLRNIGARELKGIAAPVEVSELLWAPAEVETFPLPPGLEIGIEEIFVGRDEEADTLRDRWKRAAAGERRMVLVAGEPGIGKTRLVSELAHTAHEDGAIVLFGRCDEEGLIPYQPFVEALRHYVTHAPPDELRAQMSETGGDLVRLVPELGRVVSGLPEPITGDPESERYRLFSAVAQILVDASKLAPVMLVLDDLHWADQPTLALLKHVVRAPEGGRILICGTYRDVELDRRHPFAETLSTLRRDNAYERIVLRGLTDDEIYALLERFAEHDLGPGGHALSQAIYGETEGNPFFVWEVLRYLIVSRKIYQDDEGRWTSDATSVEELEIPEGVREAVSRRLSRLSDRANQALREASVLGQRFEFAVLEHMSALGADELLEALDEALVSRLVEESKEPGTDYAFTHALVRQTLYEELNLPRKQRVHLKSGEALEAIKAAEPPLGIIAGHLRLAGVAADRDKTIGYSLLAAQAAGRLAAYEEAFGHLAAALEIMDERGFDPDVRGRTLGYLGDLTYLTGRDWAQGIAYLEEGLRIYEDLGDEVRAAQMHSRLGRAFSFGFVIDTVDVTRSMDHFRKALDVLGKGPDRMALGITLAAFSSAAQIAAQVSEAEEAARRAMAIADRLGNAALWTNAAAMCGLAVARRGGIAEGLGLLEDAYERMATLRNPFGAWVAAYSRAIMSPILLEPMEQERWARRELDQPWLAEPSERRSLLERQVAVALAIQGDLTELRNVQDPEVDAIRLIFEGQWDRAESVLTEERERTASRGFRGGPNRLNAGWIHLLRGDDDAAIAFFREGLTEHLETGWSIVVPLYSSALAEALAATGRVQEAADEVTRLDQIVSDGEDRRGQMALIERARGELAAARGRSDEMESHFGRALEILDRYHVVWERPEVFELWGRALLASGDIVRGTEKLDAAIEIYRRIDAGQPFIDRLLAFRPK